MCATFSSLTFSQTKHLLEHLDHTPRKQLGQNFLVDKNIVAKSLELGSVGPLDTVVEIGPGLGTLTGALLATGCQVYAVEYDQRLYAHLQTQYVLESTNQFHLIHADAMDQPIAAFAPSAEHDYKIIANLPYAISIPWLELVLEQPLPTLMVLMLQKEAAERLVATINTKKYAPIQIFVTGAFELVTQHAVSASCFHPRPKVASVLLVLRRRQIPFLFCKAAKQYIRGLFCQRRKQLGHLCKAHADPRLLQWLEYLGTVGIPPETRPEAIAFEHWVVLDKLLRSE